MRFTSAVTMAMTSLATGRCTNTDLWRGKRERHVQFCCKKGMTVSVVHCVHYAHQYFSLWDGNVSQLVGPPLCPRPIYVCQRQMIAMKFGAGILSAQRMNSLTFCIATSSIKYTAGWTGEKYIDIHGTYRG